VNAFQQLEPAVASLRPELDAVWERFIKELDGDRRQRLFLDALAAKRNEVKLI